MALFWHLAERWGRVSGNGVLVPLALTHRILGQLVGARRPTVSTALRELANREQLIRARLRASRRLSPIGAFAPRRLDRQTAVSFSPRRHMSALSRKPFPS
jgi:Crp-like helix-turn-helix domain